MKRFTSTALAATVLLAPVADARAAADLELRAERVLRDGGAPVAFTGTTFLLRGTTRQHAEQRVKIRVYRGGRKVRVVSRRLLPARRGTGRFRIALPAGRPGRLTVRAELVPAAGAAPLRSEPARIRVASPSAGSRVTVRALQQRLAALRYAVPRSGRYDGGTARAVIAYRKVTGMPRLGGVNRALLRRMLRGDGAFRVRFPRHGHHVEADLSRQVMALVDRGQVRRIYHISSGAPATPTVRGTFRVYRRTPGRNALGMVHSSYFIRGYAIHGYASVPVYPASHGCLRVPVPDARAIYDWIRYGDIVDVYA